MTTRYFYIALYLSAIVAANLIITTFGPEYSILTAGVFIGLSLSTRDKLHDLWGSKVAQNMGLLIVTGGVISYLLNQGAGRIAIASIAAFIISEALDGFVYHIQRHRRYLVRSNTSNIFGAASDSIIFPVLAFGGFPIVIILGQFFAKVVGGFIWSLVIYYFSKRRRLSQKTV